MKYAVWRNCLGGKVDFLDIIEADNLSEAEAKANGVGYDCNDGEYLMIEEEDNQ